MSGGLELDGVVRRGGFELALRVAVGPGEVVAVLGPNGAGKSTLLRTVAGLELLESGSLRVAGRVWQDGPVALPPEERAAGVVFQDYRLFPHLDVRDNVAFAARSSGVRRAAARDGAAAWLDRLGLADLARRRPAQLSGGQAQRVALARALAREPDVLLLDEPMAALDAGARLEVRGFLRTHLGQFAGPVVLVTHDPLEAMVLADRLVVVEQGRLVQEGTPLEVARRPASAYVARLMGLNLWSGLLDGTGRVVLDRGGSLEVATDAAPGRVLVALRPSAVSVHTEAPGRPGPVSARNRWPGRVASLERLADRVRLQVEGSPAALVDVTAAAVAELGLVEGREVWLTAKATEVEVYPEATPGRPVPPPEARPVVS
ncbi:ABC transporter ATP-binding protein [Nocardioides aurantiacus]|uniref:ABC transporter ATP-binding protein n=1 Tax=Nocardioides aurantiacus TaxID=86796 RepID=UPI00403FA2F9